jgi:hypothetical protein
MLTDTRLETLEAYNEKGIIGQLEVQQLIESYRTIQKQKKQLVGALDDLMKQSDAATIFIVKSAPYFDAKILLKNLQGGTDNANP